MPGLPAYWSRYRNFGDLLTPILYQKIHGTPLCRLSRGGGSSIRAPRKWLLGVGSIFTHRCLDGAMVWGTGYIPKGDIQGTPAAIRCLRGPLTAEALTKNGVPITTNVFGDPGLVLPKFFPPANERVYEFGVVPHLEDLDHPAVQSLKEYPGCKVVNLGRPPKVVIEEITSCERILSSSLHGLVAADAYGIPSLWIELSDKVWGNGFKFYDYYESLGVRNVKPTAVHDQDDMFLARLSTEQRLVAPSMVDGILEACPAPTEF